MCCKLQHTHTCTSSKHVLMAVLQLKDTLIEQFKQLITSEASQHYLEQSCFLLHESWEGMVASQELQEHSQICL